MATFTTLDFIPLWALFLGTVGVILLSVELGFRLGSYRLRHKEEEKEPPVGAMVGATLGLLAFLLAFTFGMAASRYDDRRGLVLDEANAIGTTYLRAELLPQPQQTEIRRLLREYVDARLQAVQPGQIGEAIQRSESLQNRLWAQAVGVGEKNPGSMVVSLFIQSLNEVIDLHAKRVTVALRSRIPLVIWGALYLVAVFSLVELGYYAGMSGSRRSLATLALVFTFSVVMLLIADLDRPQEGLMRVSQQAMIDLQNSMAPSKP